MHKWACIQLVLKIKVKVEGHVIRALLCWHENRFFSRANCWIATKLAHDDLQVSVHPGCAQGQGHGQVTYMIAQIASSSTLMAASWPNSVFSSPSVPFVRSVFFRFPILKWLWVHSVSSVCYTLRSHILSLRALTLWSIIRAYTLLPDLHYQAARSNA